MNVPGQTGAAVDRASRALPFGRGRGLFRLQQVRAVSHPAQFVVAERHVLGAKNLARIELRGGAGASVAHLQDLAQDFNLDFDHRSAAWC